MHLKLQRGSLVRRWFEVNGNLKQTCGATTRFCHPSSKVLNCITWRWMVHVGHSSRKLLMKATSVYTMLLISMKLDEPWQCRSKRVHDSCNACKGHSHILTLDISASDSLVQILLPWMSWFKGLHNSFVFNISQSSFSHWHGLGQLLVVSIWDKMRKYSINEQYELGDFQGRNIMQRQKYQRLKCQWI